MHWGSRLWGKHLDLELLTSRTWDHFLLPSVNNGQCGHLEQLCLGEAGVGEEETCRLPDDRATLWSHRLSVSHDSDMGKYFLKALKQHQGTLIHLPTPTSVNQPNGVIRASGRQNTPGFLVGWLVPAPVFSFTFMNSSTFPLPQAETSQVCTIQSTQGWCWGGESCSPCSWGSSNINP